MYVRSVGMDFLLLLLLPPSFYSRETKGTPNDRDRRGPGKHNIVYVLARQVERSWFFFY